MMIILEKGVPYPFPFKYRYILYIHGCPYHMQAASARCSSYCCQQHAECAMPKTYAGQLGARRTIIFILTILCRTVPVPAKHCLQHMSPVSNTV
jgi:hypothetical protein